MYKLAPLVLLTSSLAFAQGTPQEILRCSTVDDSVKRLECFDRVASDLQKEANAKAEAKLSQDAQTPENWTVRITQSPVDDSQTVVLITPALETVPGRFNQSAKPVLFLRCLENSTSAYISFDGLHMADLQGYGRLTFRIDKQKAFTRNTRVSTNHESLGLWDGGSAIPFIKQLFGGSKLLVQATPYSSSSVMFTLDIEGLEEAIKPLRAACKW